MPDIVVHHLEKSRSHRILWALEALELPYSIERYTRHPKTMRADPALRAIHPLGKSPVITVDGTTYAESGAILEELVDLAGGRLRPAPGTEAFRRYRFFLHYAEGSLMAPLLVRLIFDKVRTAPLPFFVKPVARGIVKKVDETFTDPEIDNHLSFLESELAGRAYLTGDELTAADIQMSYPVQAALARARGSKRPNLEGYLARLQGREDYQRALKAGGDTVLVPG